MDFWKLRPRDIQWLPQAYLGDEKLDEIKKRINSGDFDGSETVNERLYKNMRAAQAKEKAAKEAASG